MQRETREDKRRVRKGEREGFPFLPSFSAPVGETERGREPRPPHAELIMQPPLAALAMIEDPLLMTLTRVDS